MILYLDGSNRPNSTALSTRKRWTVWRRERPPTTLRSSSS